MPKLDAYPTSIGGPAALDYNCGVLPYHSQGYTVADDASAKPSVRSLELLFEAIDAIRTADLWIGPDCELLHRTGDDPIRAVRVLRAYCDSSEAHDLRRWLAANQCDDGTHDLFCALGGIAQSLQEIRNAVIDLEDSNVQAVDYPDEEFWMSVLSIEDGWNEVREQAESARSLLDGLVERIAGG